MRMNNEIHEQKDILDDLREECGVFGIYDFSGENVASTIYYGLFALQHRGQESKAGLAASNGEARRLVVQGGVLADGEKVAAPTVSFTAEQLAKGIVIKKGKKIYHKVTL